MEGAHKSVQLHNIGSMCMTSLPSQISLLWILQSNKQNCVTHMKIQGFHVVLAILAI